MMCRPKRRQLDFRVVSHCNALMSVLQLSLYFIGWLLHLVPISNSSTNRNLCTVTIPPRCNINIRLPLILAVLMEFCKMHQRAPGVTSLESDRKTLTELRQTLLTSLAVDESLIPQDFVKWVSGIQCHLYYISCDSIQWSCDNDS